MKFTNEHDSKRVFVAGHLSPFISRVTHGEVANCRYDVRDGCEIITVEYSNGYTRLVNVSMDSRIAMVKDVLRAIG
jgi:hypothetical protein